MDVISHFLLPLAAALTVLGLHRKHREDGHPEHQKNRLALAIVFGVAGASPDLDGLYAFLRHHDGLYFLQHRGFSHTFLGAPLHGIAGAGLVAIAARLLPGRLGWLHWRPAYLWVGAAGGASHLLIDGITYGGIPLFWPFWTERLSLNLYPWLLIWAFPIAGILTLLFVIRKITPRRLVQFTALLIVLMVLNAGLRLENRPEVRADEQIYPRASYREWIVLTPDEEGDGWYVQVHEDGVPREPQWHNETRITPGSERAVERAKDTNAYRGFIMNTFGPIITETEPRPDGGWSVNFTAVVPRMDAMQDPPWTPTHPKVEAWGLLVVHVDADEDEVNDEDEARVEIVRHGW